MRVISNKIHFNNSGRACGFSEPKLHSYNKGHSIQQFSSVAEDVKVSSYSVYVCIMYAVGMNVLCMYACMYVCMYVCTGYVRMYVCMNVWMYVCMYVCVYVCMLQIYGMSFMYPTTLYTFYNKDEDKLG